MEGQVISLMVGPVAVRQGVAHLRTVFEISERRACSILQADRKMVRYRSCRPPETALRERLHTLAAERRRFGYRRLFVRKRRFFPTLPEAVMAATS